MVQEIDEEIAILRIPTSFKSKDRKEDDASEWNRVARQALKKLTNILPGTQLDANTRAQVVTCVAALDGEDDFLEMETRASAQGLYWKSSLLSFVDQRFAGVLALFMPSSEITSLVLEKHIKPRFLSSPHPDLNLSTGRKLPRSAGGSSSAHDYYNEQNWKDYPGTANVVAWCLRSTPVCSHLSLYSPKHSTLTL